MAYIYTRFGMIDTESPPEVLSSREAFEQAERFLPRAYDAHQEWQNGKMAASIASGILWQNQQQRQAYDAHQARENNPLAAFFRKQEEEKKHEEHEAFLQSLTLFTRTRR